VCKCALAEFKFAEGSVVPGLPELAEVCFLVARVVTSLLRSARGGPEMSSSPLRYARSC
jgi:hypothetical protein